MWSSRVSTKSMTVAVAKNCKMTKKSDIDDVINTSKMSDMPQNFLNGPDVSNRLYISSFKSIKSVYSTCSGQYVWKNTSRFMWGWCTPSFWVATETTFHSSEKWKTLTIDAWDSFDNTCKKSFSYLEEQSQKSKKFVKGGCTPPIDPSPIINLSQSFLVNCQLSSNGPVKTKIWTQKAKGLLLEDVNKLLVKI